MEKRPNSYHHFKDNIWRYILVTQLIASDLYGTSACIKRRNTKRNLITLSMIYVFEVWECGSNECKTKFRSVTGSWLFLVFGVMRYWKYPESPLAADGVSPVSKEKADGVVRVETDGGCEKYVASVTSEGYNSWEALNWVLNNRALGHGVDSDISLLHDWVQSRNRWVCKCREKKR